MLKKISTLLIVMIMASSMAYCAEKVVEKAADPYAKNRAAAKQLVNDAVKYFEENGREATIKEVNKKDGKFVKDELYVFIHDISTPGTLVCAAHPMSPALIGKDLWNLSDTNGKLFNQEFAKVAKEKGEGVVDYVWKQPKTLKFTPKETFLKLAKDKHSIILCGYYLE